MADTAAHPVDHVIPGGPVRQWVLSLPYVLRFRAVFDFALMGELLSIFVREVFASLRKRARENGVLKGKCGSVTFVQRFGSAASCHLHFHAIVFDGVYACADQNEPPRFYPLLPPDAKDVAAIGPFGVRRVLSLVARNLLQLKADRIECRPVRAFEEAQNVSSGT